MSGTTAGKLMSKIREVKGLEILDSRGRPTVKVTVLLDDGTTAAASVPSGASTGSAEAIELRDGDPQRYGGMGCRKAVANIGGEIRDSLQGKTFDHAFDLDQVLINLDGTDNKSRLGANAILAVSIAFARAQARQRGVPLYQYFAQLIDRELTTIPRLTINLFSGGLHAGKIVPIQDSLVVPVSTDSIVDSLAMTYTVFQAAAALIKERYGMRALTADEGGLSPDFESAEDMLARTVESIERAGFQAGEQIAIAVDVAASHFFDGGAYCIGGRRLSSEQMIGVLDSWLSEFPIISLEDGLHENDWENWPALRRCCHGRSIVLGDDLLCTNEQRISKAIACDAANALLLKVNQIGTLYEAAKALWLARDSKWTVTISARSGETEDDWLADLATGWGGDYIKIGSITQSERLAKYNRLLEIEAETGLPLAELPER